MTMRHNLILAAGAVLGIVGLAPEADAVVFPFEVFECVGCGTVTASGEVDVQSLGGDPEQVTFTFTNTTPVTTGNNSAITEIYFEERFDTIIASAGITAENNVEFTETTGNLPAGNTIGFETGTFNFAAFDADPPPSGNGIENVSGDSLVITATLLAGQTLADVLAQMNGGIGAHFQGGCTAGEDDTSCAAVTVPLPAALWLFLSAIGGLFGLNRWMRREQKSEALAA